MEGKKSGNKAASPQGPGHPLQYEKQEQRVEQVKKDIGQVMSLGIQAIELVVQHVGQPGQRMSVGYMGRSESPDHAI